MKEINRCWGREQHRAEGIQLVWQVLSEKVTFKLTPEKKEKKRKKFFTKGAKRTPFKLEEVASSKTVRVSIWSMVRKEN